MPNSINYFVAQTISATAVPGFIGKLGDYGVTLGSRYVAGGCVKHWSLRRRLLSRAANIYVNAVLGTPVRDITSGFLCMSREALERVPVQETMSDGYAFVAELKYLLSRAGSPLVEHPIVFTERREGQSKMSSSKIWESVWMPWRIRWNNRIAPAAPRLIER